MTSISRRLLSTALAGTTLFGLAFPAPLAAQGDLLIAPTRLVLDGRRGGEVILSNIGNEEATYRVELELRRMTPEGELEPVESVDANLTEKAALEMIRYAPRRVTLPPDEPQAIRISARPGAELPDGLVVALPEQHHDQVLGIGQAEGVEHRPVARRHSP